MFYGHDAVAGLGAATSQRTHPSAHLTFVERFTHGDHDAGEFHAGNVLGPPRRSGVVALKLREVGRVYAGGAHRHENVARTRYRGFALSVVKRTVVNR